MLKAILISLLGLLAVSPAFAATQVTVKQLKGIIVSLHKKKDAKAARRLYTLELTESLSPRNLAAFNAELPGQKSRQALLILADLSVFFPPPPSEVSHRPAPPIQQQQAIINKTISYTAATLHRLPDLFAHITTVRYYNAPPISLANPTAERSLLYGKIHKVNQTDATVLYRDGKEVIQKNARQPKHNAPSSSYMTTYGEFGPIFSILFRDFPKGKLAWSHWRPGSNGMEAVFHFEVPRRASHYRVDFCCVAGRVSGAFRAYHGAITIDPSTGTILRLIVITNAIPDTPLTYSGMMVQYGPVTLGGKKYFCPIRSIAVHRAQGVSPLRRAIRSVWSLARDSSASGETDVPMETQLNETVYSHYHLFRADVHIFPVTGHPSTQPPGQPQ